MIEQRSKSLQVYFFWLKLLEEKFSTNIVVSVISIVVVVAVICAIVVMFVWRRKGIFKSPWRNTSSADGNQPSTVGVEGKFKQNYSIDNPGYEPYEQLVEIDDIAISGCVVGYTPTDKVRSS